MTDRLDAETIAWARDRWPYPLAESLDYFLRLYHEPLRRKLNIEEADALECASGGGLAALAFLIAGGRSVLGVDKTESRVRFARELARRLGFQGRAEFEVGDIHLLPDTTFDVCVSLQTLEHVPKPHEALKGLGRRARHAVLVSTPNRLWPRDGHDTGLLFAHWLPARLRRPYAELRGARTDQLCTFLSPLEVEGCLPEFDRVSGFYTFDTVGQWLEQFPLYFPYGRPPGRLLGPRSSAPTWRMASSLARRSTRMAQMFAPMNEGIYIRRSSAMRGAERPGARPLGRRFGPQNATRTL